MADHGAQAQSEVEEEKKIEGGVMMLLKRTVMLTVTKKATNRPLMKLKERNFTINYNGLRQPTFAPYNNPNRIDDTDLGSSSNDSNNSVSTDAEISDALEEADDFFDINLTQIPATEESRERTFAKGDKTRDISKVKKICLIDSWRRNSWNTKE